MPSNREQKEVVPAMRRNPCYRTFLGASWVGGEAVTSLPACCLARTRCFDFTTCSGGLPPVPAFEIVDYSLFDKYAAVGKETSAVGVMSLTVFP